MLDLVNPVKTYTPIVLEAGIIFSSPVLLHIVPGCHEEQ